MESSQTAMLEAAYQGDVNRVRSLLQQDPALAKMQGARERWEGATPLTLAALAGHLEIATLLIEHDAAMNPITQDGSALLMATWGGNLPMGQLLRSGLHHAPAAKLP